MSEFNFKGPSKQAIRGIIFLILPSVAKSLKTAYLPLLFYIYQVFKNPEQYRQYLFYIILVAFALIVFAIVRGILSFNNFKFQVSNDYFVLQKGIFKKQRLEISLLKIQNVHISQNFLQRFLGVVGLSIDTAGDKTTEVIIKSLTTEKALALKKLLVNSEIQDTEREIDETVLKISLLELIIAGLTYNHFNSFYILSALIFGFLIDFRDILDTFGYNDLLDDFTTKASSGTYLTFVIYLMTLIVAIFGSIIYSLGKVLINNYDLKIQYSKGDIEIEKGLFNRLNYSLKSSRIQTLMYRTNRLKLKFGMYSVRFHQAMAGIKSNKNIEIEGIKKENLSRFEQFVFGYTINNIVEDKIKPHPYFKRQLFFRMFYLLILINAIGISLFGLMFSFICLILIPWFCFLIYLRYQKSYYNNQKKYFILGEGRIDTVTNIFEHHKIQSLKLKQSFFQKKHNVASITIYTASNFITIPSIPYLDAIKLYDDLLYKVEITNLDWI